MNDPIQALQADQIDLRYKGFAPSISGESVADLAQRGCALTDAGFTFPLLTLQESAVEHNLAAMARYCSEHDVRIAPHGKSTMSPELHALQLEAGAWALTAATVHQVAVYRSFGVARILLANELADEQAMRWLASELAADPEFEFICFADSLAGVELLAGAAGELRGARRVGVLVEVGYPGGRAGCRTVAETLDVASAVNAAAPLRLAGVAGYEGLLGSDYTAAEAAVTGYLRSLKNAASEILGAGLHDARREFVVSCGGSAFFDLVTRELTGGWPDGAQVEVVLRCGSYLTHDDGMYERVSPFARDPALGGPLQPALLLWAHVLSVPEPGLAIAGAGRRDLPYDAGLPRPKLVWRRGAAGPEVLAGTTTAGLNDHHAFVRPVPDQPVAVGDLIGFGISHPCSAFDKWRLIPLLDDRWQVAGCVHTFF
jgi:D-serine deaminase-like pyridoxal phosphate-dependent protein